MLKSRTERAFLSCLLIFRSFPFSYFWRVNYVVMLPVCWKSRRLQLESPTCVGVRYRFIPVAAGGGAADGVVRGPRDRLHGGGALQEVTAARREAGLPAASYHQLPRVEGRAGPADHRRRGNRQLQRGPCCVPGECRMQRSRVRLAVLFLPRPDCFQRNHKILIFKERQLRIQCGRNSTIT